MTNPIFSRMAPVFVLALGGCASNSGVVPIGAGNYMITKQAATGFGGLGSLKAKTLTEANRFCEAKGLSMRMISSQESKPPYILANYPRTEITFTCDPR